MSEKLKVFDPTFEEKIIQTILVDHMFGQQIMEVMDPSYFDMIHTETLSQMLKDYYFQYEAFPSADLIPSILEKQIKNPITLKKCNSFLTKIQKKPLNGDLEYVKERSLEFFRLQNIYKTFDEEVLPRIEEGSGKLDEIVPIIEKAVNKGTDSDLGYDYVYDEEARFSEEELKTVPTGWPIINKMLKGGGFGEGRLVTFIAPAGSGKSTIGVNIGKAALLQGLIVIHYTFELDWREIAEKYDASISGIEIKNLSGNKTQILHRLKAKLPESARLIIKEYPVRGASIQTIKAHLAKLKLSGIVPDLVVIDQGGNLKSVSKNQEERFNLADNWLDMKNLAQTQKCPVITFHQVNRLGAEDDVILPDKISGCWDIIGTTDALITMARNVQQKQAGIGKMYFGKNRQGEDGVILGYTMNGSIALIDVFEITEEFEEQLRQLKEDEGYEKNLTLQAKLSKFIEERKQ